MKNLKQQLFITALLVLSIGSMFLSWFGGARGIQELKGTLVLFHPITLISFLFAAIGVWIKSGKYSKVIALLGLSGIIIMELFYFFTWYLKTITLKFSITTCFQMAYPEYYIGLCLSVLSLAFYLRFAYFRNKNL